MIDGNNIYSVPLSNLGSRNTPAANTAEAAASAAIALNVIPATI